MTGVFEQSQHEKVIALDALLEQRARHRDAGKTVVHCHGCFDIVHPGHIRYLRQAKALGDILVVTLTADRFIHKGYDRPYIHQDLRAENLAVIDFIDHVHINDAETALELLEELQPDIYVKGKEYESSQDPRFVREKQAVERHGGEVYFSSGDVVFSSTKLLEHFREDISLDQERIDFFCRHHRIDTARVERALDAAADHKKVVLLGDPIMDVYVHCEDMSVAAEGPLISVAPIHEVSYAGGGALIAMQLAAVGVDVTLITTRPEGERGLAFQQQLERANVNLVMLPCPQRPTYVKTRYLVENQKVFKINQGGHAPLGSVEVREMLSLLEENLEGADFFMVVDFGYGLLGTQLIEGIQQIITQRDIPFSIDVSRAGITNLLKFKGPALATPTEDELRFAFGDLENGLSNLATRFYEQTEAKHLVITLGSRGCVFFAPPLEPGARLQAHYLPAFTQHPRDVVGAGDAFLAAYIATILAKEEPVVGLYLGSLVAAMHVSRLGNAPLSLAQLQNTLNRRDELARANHARHKPQETS